jgi:hypothetical protein
MTAWQLDKLASWHSQQRVQTIGAECIGFFFVMRHVPRSELKHYLTKQSPELPMTSTVVALM